MRKGVHQSSSKYAHHRYHQKVVVWFPDIVVKGCVSVAHNIHGDIFRKTWWTTDNVSRLVAGQFPRYLVQWFFVFCAPWAQYWHPQHQWTLSLPVFVLAWLENKIFLFDKFSHVTKNFTWFVLWSLNLKKRKAHDLVVLKTWLQWFSLCTKGFNKWATSVAVGAFDLLQTNRSTALTIMSCDGGAFHY